MLHNKFTVANLLAWFEPSLTQPHPSLEFIIKNSISAEQEEEVFLVSFAGFALDVPIVLSRHVVLILLLVLVVHLAGEVCPPLLQRCVRGKEVSYELFPRFVHDSADHCLGHLFQLPGRGNANRGGVAVKYNLGAWILPHFTVRQNIHNLDWIYSSFAVMFLNRNLSVLESLVDGVDLSISVHVQFYAHAILQILLHTHSKISLNILNSCWLVPGLFGGDVIWPSHP